MYIYLAKSECLGRHFLNWHTHTSEGWDDYGGEAKLLGRVFPVAQMRPQFIQATRAEQLKRDRVAECGLSGHISYAQEQGYSFALVRQSQIANAMLRPCSNADKARLPFPALHLRVQHSNPSGGG